MDENKNANRIYESCQRADFKSPLTFIQHWEIKLHEKQLYILASKTKIF